MKKIILLSGFLLFTFLGNSFALTITYEEFKNETSDFFNGNILTLVNQSDVVDNATKTTLNTMSIHDFVQAVLRESYLIQTEILEDYADKVAKYNDLKDDVRERLGDIRDAKNEWSNQLEFDLLPYLYFMGYHSTPTIVSVSDIDSDSINTINQFLSKAPFNNYRFEQSTPVPEPSTIILICTGLIGLSGLGRKKFIKK